MVQDVTGEILIDDKQMDVMDVREAIAMWIARVVQLSTELISGPRNARFIKWHDSIYMDPEKQSSLK